MSIKKRLLIESAVLFVTILAVVLVIQRSQDASNDWERFYRPAIGLLLTGKNPYDIQGFFNPAYILVPLAPLALLPPKIGLAVLSALAVAGYYLAARRLGASPLVAGAMVSNPLYLIHNLGNPTIDWIIALAYTLPPSLPAYLLLLAKPQLGFGVAFCALRRHPRPVLAACGAVALTLFVYGVYVFSWSAPINTEHNWSLFPYSLIVGIPLLLYACRKNDTGLALLATPLIAPFVGYYSLPVALLGLLPKHPRLAAAMSLAISAVFVGYALVLAF